MDIVSALRIALYFSLAVNKKFGVVLASRRKVVHSCGNIDVSVKIVLMHASRLRLALSY